MFKKTMGAMLATFAAADINQDKWSQFVDEFAATSPVSLDS